MFSKILVANRGEIACRVMRTARRMGIVTVAVHSEADARALHVRMADEAVAIGPSPAAESYLVIERIVEAARSSGADAVHPGYGFLSENAAFARALEAAGIAFIGPPAPAIEAMGDKIESKRAAAAAGVATVPGSAGEVADAGEAARIAAEIGYPVMIKASAGGGGKGMRIARTPDEIGEGFERATSEARASFGDGRVFVEKFIEQPRHVEIQVLGDRHGNIIHLGERECSVQRRNQKVVEEAPSPLVNDAMRDAMGEQAVALARAVDYHSAGTVEFVAGQDRSFYFLEMNTRLQVEHPVTELVTGIDLVEQMIRIAAGERLSIGQADVRMHGWAVESRIYAEDPERGFVPSTGRLIRFAPPVEGGDDRRATVRLDTGVEEGDEISRFYDPMVAKLVTHAPDRTAAIDRMGAALDAFHIGGIRHNLTFLSALMANPRWRAGDLSTAFIDEEFPGGFRPAGPVDEQARRLAAVAACAGHLHETRRLSLSGRLRHEVPHPPLSRVVRGGGADRLLEVSGAAPDYRVAFVDDGDGDVWNVHSHWVPGRPIWVGRVNGEGMSVHIEPTSTGYALSHGGVAAEFSVMRRRAAELAALMPERTGADTSKRLLCPMPGIVVSLAVAEGQEVRAGEPLAVVEAMKMENVLRAEADAVVARILVAPGDSLAVDAVIMEFA